MPSLKPDTPPGISVLQKFFPNAAVPSQKKIGWRGFTLFITFIIYTCYHASRRPLSVVKTILHANCTNVQPPPGTNSSVDPEWCSWKPFDTTDSNRLFGLLDSAFLFSYAFAMFFSGFVAERVNLRYFLTIGTFMSGTCVYLLGLAKIYNIHALSYFFTVQLFGGIFQTAGWPGVVTVMGNWFGEDKSGLIFGIWNSHTSVGNIVGTLLAGAFVETNWAMSFMVIGFITMALAVIIFLFLVSEPVPHRTPEKNRSTLEDHSDATTSQEAEDKNRVEQRPILSANRAQVRPVSFFEALRIPGVIEFSFSLFFAKLVSYTFLYWLPMYINTSTSFGPELSAYISILFDIGGMIGGILAGAVSDYTGMQAFTCGAMLVYCVPVLYIYYLYGDQCLWISVVLLLICGALVNGPYALITTAVSAKLGLNPTLSENTKALSTVSAIIDGTGSIGAAVGPLFAGFVSDMFGWEYVFFMLMISDLLSLCMLFRLMKNELQSFTRSRNHAWSS